MYTLSWAGHILMWQEDVHKLQFKKNATKCNESTELFRNSFCNVLVYVNVTCSYITTSERPMLSPRYFQNSMYTLYLQP